MSEAADLVASLVLEDGRRWGEVATDVQVASARAVLEPGPDDPRLHWAELPKGHSKSTDAGAWSLAWLICQAPELGEGIVAAADEDQANRLIDKARGLVSRSGLGDIVRIEAKRLVSVRTGAKVVALASDASSSEGLLAGWYVLDEVPRWPETRSARTMWESLFSGVPKVPGARFAVLGHAGDPGHWSYRLRENARRSPRWRFVHLDGPTPWLDPGDLAEQEAVLLPSEFARRHLNVWQAAEDRLATSEDVHACLRHSGPLAPEPGVTGYIATLDVGLTNDRTVATVGHAVQVDGARRVVMDRQVSWQGSKAQPVDLGMVEGWLAEAHREYRLRKVIVDPYQAAHLTQRLRHRGVPVSTYTFSAASVGKLAVTLFRALRDHLLDLPDDDPELVDELVNVRLRESSPGVYRIDHDSSRHDDRVIGLALLAQELLGDAAGPVRAHAPLPTREAPWRGRGVQAGAPGVAGRSSGRPGRVRSPWESGGRTGWGAGRTGRVSTTRSER